MKIGYFTISDVGVSETFMQDLIIGLEGKGDKNQLVHVVGKKNGNIVANDTLFTNFYLNNSITKFIYEIEERAKLNTRFTIKIKQLWVDQKLKKCFNNNLPDVAFIEYGHSAVILHKFLTENSIPYVVHFHGYDATSAFNSYQYTSEIKKVFQNALFIIVASHHMQRLLVLKGCPSEKIHIIRLGIDVKSMHPIKWSERIKKDPSIVFLGRLTEKKNPIALLHAFHIVKKKISNATLTIIGDGKLKQEVIENIKYLKLNSAVNVLGSLNQRDAFQIIRQHWVYAQHSVTANDGDQEGYAISPAEAAAFELPVVSTIHNGIPEHVINGRTGFLVREFDYVAMGEKIIELLSNTELAEKMGKEGRKNIAQLNDPKVRIDSIYKLIEKAFIESKEFIT